MLTQARALEKTRDRRQSKHGSARHEAQAQVVPTLFDLIIHFGSLRYRRAGYSKPYLVRPQTSPCAAKLKSPFEARSFVITLRTGASRNCMPRKAYKLHSDFLC